jgi:GntR family transcriptional regulator, sialic acid-inducible nan operon repressor
MQALAGKGLVEISQGERAKVLRITAESIFRQVDLPAKMMLSGSSDSLEHLKSARIFFERGMIREATAKATPEHITELNALLAKQKQSLGDADAFIEADMQFHQYIAQISGNPIFAAVSGAMLGWLKSYHTEMLIWTGRENFTLAEHAEIIRTIEKGNADLAEKAMIKHLERSRALYALKERT